MKSQRSDFSRKRRAPVSMFVMPVACNERDIVGLHAVPNRLGQVRRLPGETLAMMERRALHSVTGGGDLVVYPMVRD